VQLLVTVVAPLVTVTLSTWDPVGEVGEIVAVLVNDPLADVVVEAKVPTAAFVKLPVTGAVAWKPEPVMATVVPRAAVRGQTILALEYGPEGARRTSAPVAIGIPMTKPSNTAAPRRMPRCVRTTWAIPVVILLGTECSAFQPEMSRPGGA